MAVSAGFTAPMLGKKLVSTIYKLSNSCALQSTSSTNVFGVSAEADCPCLVCYTANADLIFHVEVARNQMIRVHP